MTIPLARKYSLNLLIPKIGSWHTNWNTQSNFSKKASSIKSHICKVLLNRNVLEIHWSKSVPKILLYADFNIFSSPCSVFYDKLASRLSANTMNFCPLCLCKLRLQAVPHDATVFEAYVIYHYKNAINCPARDDMPLYFPRSFSVFFLA